MSSKVRVEAETSPKSRLKNPGIVKIGVLKVLLSCIIILLKAKSLSGLVRIIKLYKRFF